MQAQRTRSLVLPALLLGLVAGALTLPTGCGTAARSGAMQPPTTAGASEAENGLLDAYGEELWIIPKSLSSFDLAGSEGDDGEDANGFFEDEVELEEVEDLIREDATVQHDEIDGLTWSDVPGGGGLVARDPETQALIPVPLQHTAVRGAVAGHLASVTVAQHFANPYDEKIEAVYVFPLSHAAAVSGFLMRVGDRTIRGIVRDREEAEEIYRAARAQGYVASLLTQERPNVFTQRVANLEPGKAIDVEIEYFETVPLVDGWYQLVFPMVVGPRFNPPGSTDGVGAVPRDGTGASGQSTEVPYLRPDERSGHDVELAFDLAAGTEIDGLECRSHAIDVERPTPDRARVTLQAHDRIPNKDFVLRWKLSGEHVKSGFLTHRGADGGGWFALTLHPPQDLTQLDRVPMEMVMVLDTSGSMSGEPLDQAKQAVRRMLRRLEPADSFRLMRFANDASQLSASPLDASATNLDRGQRWISDLDAGGGTMMVEGMRTALETAHDAERLRVVAFLTDGFIGNEEEVLRTVRSHLGAARVFSFGIGSSPNRYLMAEMALEGRGAVEYVGPDDDAAGLMDAYFTRISRPALANVSIDWGDLEVTDVHPSSIPDLVVGRPVTLVGRFRAPTGAGARTITVHGEAAGVRRHHYVHFELPPGDAGHPALAKLWARAKIADQARALRHESDADEREALATSIRDLALEHGLMSSYTAFVAVDSLSATAGEQGTTVTVPVPVPAGVRYETTVGSGG